MEAKEEIYQYIRKNIKEDGVTAQSIAEIFGIKRNVASHYLNLLEKEGKLQKGTNRPVHFSIPTDTEKKAEECNNMIDERPVAQKEVSVFSKFIKLFFGCDFISRARSDQPIFLFITAVIFPFEITQ